MKLPIFPNCHFGYLDIWQFQKVPPCPQSPKSPKSPYTPYTPYTPFPQNPPNPQFPHNGDFGDIEDFNPQTTKKMLTKIAFQKAACKGQALRVLK